MFSCRDVSCFDLPTKGAAGRTDVAEALDHERLVLERAELERGKGLTAREDRAAPGCRLAPERAVEPDGLAGYDAGREACGVGWVVVVVMVEGGRESIRGFERESN